MVPMIDILILAGVALAVLLLLIQIFFNLRNRAAEHETAARLQILNDKLSEQNRQLLDELHRITQQANESQLNVMKLNATQQSQSLADIDKRIIQIAQYNQERLEKMTDSLSVGLEQMRDSNEKKLDQMRQIVDEKLHATLEKRLGESFKHVSNHLEAVQRGLGEMRTLANGVGDLKRVLTNVKARGTWGEVQLENLLEDLLTPDQYEKNVATRPNTQQRVEFALKFPGQGDAPVWLPIDAKFPQEDYLRIVSASEQADAQALQQARQALQRSIKLFAKDIATKYVAPPYTTDFAIMFLPTEGLYAEVLRTPGVVETLQQEYRIVIAGPVTLSALLNSLRIGFKTLAIEQRSSEVWQILAGVKTEFGKFADVLDKVKRQLNTASNTLEQTGVRTRAMERQLMDVESLAEPVSEKLIDNIDS